MTLYLSVPAPSKRGAGARLPIHCLFCAAMLLFLLLPGAGRAAGDKMEEEILQLINEIRVEAGVQPLQSNDQLAPVARLRAKEITSKFSHQRPNGKLWCSALTEYNVPSRYAGENLAYGFSSATDVVDAWMESASHRKIILDGRYNATALSSKKVNGTIYWCQVFADSEDTGSVIVSAGPAPLEAGPALYPPIASGDILPRYRITRRDG